MQSEAFNGAGNRWASGFSAHPGRQAGKYHGKMSNKSLPFSIYHPCSFLAPGKWPWTRLECHHLILRHLQQVRAVPDGNRSLAALQTKELFSFSIRNQMKTFSLFQVFYFCLELFFPFFAMLRQEKEKKNQRSKRENARKGGKDGGESILEVEKS